jgi:hypothetical protein
MGLSQFELIEVAALIAWMLVVRVGDVVKDGAKRRRLRRSSILDNIANTNRVPSKRSRPLSGPTRRHLCFSAASKIIDIFQYFARPCAVRGANPYQICAGRLRLRISRPGPSGRANRMSLKEDMPCELTT